MKIGFNSNATMLYAHIESPEHRIDHMRHLRDLQDETNGFNAFIPLSFQPHDNDMGINTFSNGSDDLRTIAISRLYLDNFQHIKSYWIMTGQDIAQLGLLFGANDLDGTVVDEKISAMAGGRSGIAMAKDSICKLINGIELNPCERDTLYNPLHKKNEQPIDPYSHRVPRGIKNAKMVMNMDSSNYETVLLNNNSDLKTLIDSVQKQTNAKLLLRGSAPQWTFAEFLRLLESVETMHIAIDMEVIPLMSPVRTGAALNQHPVCKVLPVLAKFVDEIVDHQNLVQNFDELFLYETQKRPNIGSKILLIVDFKYLKNLQSCLSDF